MSLELSQVVVGLNTVGTQTESTAKHLAINPWVAIFMMVIFLLFFLLVILPRALNDILGIGSSLAILVAGIAISSLPLALNALQIPISTVTKADPGKLPRQVQLTNLQPASFTFNWETNEAVLSAIRYGTDPQLLDQAAFNIEPLEKTTQHQVVVIGLEPDTTYFVEIISGGFRYQLENQPLEIHTPAVPILSPE
jgi:hypothetical protein